MKALFDKKQDCCGCEACVNVCPQQILQMRSDEEGFFIRPLSILKNALIAGVVKQFVLLRMFMLLMALLSQE